MSKIVPIARLIKVVLAQDTHDLVRVAAALERKSLRKFARDAVMAESRRLTAGLRLRTAGQSKSK